MKLLRRVFCWLKKLAYLYLEEMQRQSEHEMYWLDYGGPRYPNVSSRFRGFM